MGSLWAWGALMLVGFGGEAEVALGSECLVSVAELGACAWAKGPLGQVGELNQKQLGDAPDPSKGKYRGADLVQKLGPADRDEGSGVNVLVWRVEGGRELSYSVAGPCGQILGGPRVGKRGSVKGLAHGEFGR